MVCSSLYAGKKAVTETRCTCKRTSRAGSDSEFDTIFQSHASQPETSERERQLTQISVCGIGPPLHRQKKLLCRIARPPCILNKEQILPLQNPCQSEVEAQGVY